MKNYYKIIVVSIILIIIGVFVFYGWQHSAQIDAGPDKQEEIVVSPDRMVEYIVSENDTYGKIMTEQGFATSVAQSIYQSALEIYDLAKINVGRPVRFYFQPDSDQFYKLYYQLDSEEELWVEKNNDNSWQTIRQAIPYEVKVKTSQGTIENFLYADALAAGVDERAVIAWAEVLQWSLDFAMDVRVGDSYTFIYEERFLNNEYVMPGKVLAGKFVNDGKAYYAFYYQDPEGNSGYYDEKGNNVQKMFLKAPVAFKYISSGFTTGLRYIQAFDISTGHRAIDYSRHTS